MPAELERLEIRALEPDDPPVIEAAFRAIGWRKPAALYARYLEEQARGLRDVFVARVAGRLDGYVTLAWRPDHPPLRAAGLPEIQDLNVLPAFRRRGIATRLVDRAESVASLRVSEVGVGVGLHPGYNAAQRMYGLRGYVPDGHGVSHRGRPVREGETAVFDDDLVLHLSKRLTEGREP